VSFEKIPLPNLKPLWKRVIWATVQKIEREKQYKPNTHNPTRLEHRGE